LCDAGSCGQYCKSVKIAPPGSYLSEHLTASIEQTYKELIGECNPNHVVASGWIAIFTDAPFTEPQAARVFSSVGA